MKRKLTEREQAERAYYKIVARLLKAKLPRARERLERARVAAFEQIPPDSPRQKLKAALTLSPSAKESYLSGAKHGIVPALAKGNVEPFFRALETFPELFAVPEIMENTLVVWMANRLWKNARGNAARENLTRLAKILATIPGAPEYETVEERVAVRRKKWAVKSKEYYGRQTKRAGTKKSH